MKGELSSKMMTFTPLRPKTYPYLTYSNNENKTVKGIKKVFHKTKT